jgi:phenylacetate-CoA ligase
MSNQKSPGADLEPIEKASRDELQALQLQRMKWSLQHAYDNVPHYRKKYDAAGVHPSDLRQLSDLAKFPFTTKADLRDTYPFGLFACRCERDRAPARLVRHHRQADRRRLHEADLAMWAGHGALARAAGGRRRHASSTPTATACSPAGSAPTTARGLGCTVIPMSGGRPRSRCS